MVKVRFNTHAHKIKARQYIIYCQSEGYIMATVSRANIRFQNYRSFPLIGEFFTRSFMKVKKKKSILLKHLIDHLNLK